MEPPVPITQPYLPLKSIAIALIFCVLLGPLGILYSSVLGASIMLIIGFVVISHMLMVPIILLWVISCIWGVAAANRYNHKIIKKMAFTKK